LSQHHTAASNKVYQLLAHGRWFSPGTPVSSITKTGRHEKSESGVKHQKSINKFYYMPRFLISCDVETSWF
jgi:hypothetical protein